MQIVRGVCFSLFLFYDARCVRRIEICTLGFAFHLLKLQIGLFVEPRDLYLAACNFAGLIENCLPSSSFYFGPIISIGISICSSAGFPWRTWSEGRKRPPRVSGWGSADRSMHICGLCFLCCRLAGWLAKFVMWSKGTTQSLVNAFVRGNCRGFAGRDWEWNAMTDSWPWGGGKMAKWPRTKAKSPTCTHNNDPDFMAPAILRSRIGNTYVGYLYINLADCISFGFADLHLWESIATLASASDFV